MPTSAQDASITWGSVTLTEVTDYTVDAVTSYGASHGDYGTVTVRSLGNAISPSLFGYYRLLTISHKGVVVFKAGCVVERVRIEAATNGVLQYAIAFRVVYPSRAY